MLSILALLRWMYKSNPLPPYLPECFYQFLAFHSFEGNASVQGRSVCLTLMWCRASLELQHEPPNGYHSMGLY